MRFDGVNVRAAALTYPANHAVFATLHLVSRAWL